MPLLARLILLLALLVPAAPALAQAVAQHLFFEAVTDDVPADLPYEARQRLTERARDEIVPAVLRDGGIDLAGAATDLRMGGYQRRTNPSLHMAVTLGDGPADRLAAALAWVLDQDSVLVADFASADGATGYALVRFLVCFPGGTLTPDHAQRFFLAAAAVEDGLGGGYTAFGDTMLFLNLRGADGRPFSGLSDADFTAALGRAVATFPGAALAETGRADARLIERPSAAPSPTLAPLRARHAALVLQTRTPEPAR
ncbi:hypothetical protein [Azospirillum rugosum]|uniref:Uncharacterized protein n=1 Tax=Azospirillum rugosum TaxID=416170 RepID=A0ABS4SQT8_9PROT|nr:hypothetical protein [Azospirillum rugosum]MBP2294924.1 hypothetical protein [Azospirillum rugosum]MDQ0528154.1 hypothetical protein [Azospirillum rugosum]